MGWMIAVLCLSVSAAWAGPEAGNTQTAAAGAEPLTLDRALALAQRTNKTYRRQVEREGQAESKWWQAVLAFGPTAGLSGSYVLANKPMTMVLDMPGLPMPMEIETSTNYYAGQLSVSQPLFTGFKLLNGFRIAGLQYDSAKDTTRVARTQLHLDVTRAFYNAMVTEQLTQVTEASLESMQQHLEIVKARYREGAASNFEVLRAQVQLANMQPNFLKLRMALSLAKSNLATLTGLDLKQNIQLGGSLKCDEEQWASLEDLQTQALSRRLEIKNLERAKQMAEIGHTLAATSNLPNVALTGAWTYYDTADKDFPPEGSNLKHSWQIGLGFSWPFWDNLAAIPKSWGASSQVREAELGKQALEDGIRLDVESSYLSLTTAKQTLDAQSQTTALAKESYRLAENQYANGMATNLDVMDAQIALNQAEINYLQAQYDYRVAGEKLHQAIGDAF